MPGTRGSKNPALLVETRPRTAPALVYVCGARPLRFGDYMLSEGVEVPGAADWPRVEAWVGARSIRPAYAGEEYITFEDFKARVDTERALAEQMAAEVEAEAEQEALVRTE